MKKTRLRSSCSHVMLLFIIQANYMCLYSMNGKRPFKVEKQDPISVGDVLSM